MTFCFNCGTQLKDDAKFCYQCGAPVKYDAKKINDERTQEKAGKLIKCPNCGELFDSFVFECPACGYELRNPYITSQAHELSLKLEQIDSQEQRVELIRNFYIPNTKEDICEFMILASSNISSNSEETEAWIAKMEQAYQKAKLTFGNSANFTYIESLYFETMDKSKSKKLVIKIGKSYFLKAFICFLLGIVLIIIGSSIMAITGDDDHPLGILSLIGLYPIFGAGFFIFKALSEKKK